MAELWDDIQAVKDKIKSILDAADYGDTALNTTIVGDKVDLYQVQPPQLWVLPTESPIEIQSAMNETWRLRYEILALVKELTPEAGKALAQELVLRASDAILANRNLDGLAQDVVRTAWVPADEIQDKQNMYGSRLMVEVRMYNRAI